MYLAFLVKDRKTKNESYWTGLTYIERIAAKQCKKKVAEAEEKGYKCKYWDFLLQNFTLVPDIVSLYNSYSVTYF